MKFQLVDPTALIRDPHTRMHLPAEFVRSEADPYFSFYIRREREGALRIVVETTTPIGNEPIKPLTTR